MKTKKIEHNKYETCKLTKKKINTEKDDYAIIVDCRGDDVQGVGFYKLDTLRNLLVGNLKEVKEEVKDEVMDNVMNTARNMLSKLGIVR